MPNTQTGPYPVLFAKNTTRARINLQTTVGGTHFRRSLGPGETKEVPWVIAKSAGFHRLWSDGSLEVSDKFDFETTLDELPSIGADGGPAKWEEIEGVPEEFTPADHPRSWHEIDDKPATFPPADHSHSWAQVTNKPTEFTPSTHTHAITEITNLQTELNGKASATDPRFEDARTPVDHDHAIADVTGLQPALDSKSASDHSHSWAQVTGKPTTFAPSSHNHTTAQVTGLDAALADKVDDSDARLTDARTPTAHTHAWADITDKPTIPPAAPVAAAQADSTAGDVEGLVTDFNALLGKLRAAGIIAES